MSIQTIAPVRLNELKNEGTHVDLIDVRTPVEFREIHVPFARNVPLDTLRPADLMGHRNGNAEEPLYVICRSGKRAQMACEKILAAGYPNIVSVDGGTDAWAQSGLPVVRGKKAMSLERQVRVAAGSLVLIGLGLGFLHQGFLALSAFVGAGLVFAGITDTCGMGILLSKMPWNQVKSAPQESSQQIASAQAAEYGLQRTNETATCSK
ncbi:MAG: rhodanese-like domain-containing protein [Gemmataceae bacterium]